MRVDKLKALLEPLDDSLEVFFRTVEPTLGTIAPADTVKTDTYLFFGVQVPCVLITNEDKEEPEYGTHLDAM